jgi:RNA polymerase sigma-70 factor (ECF subfamily)
VDPSRFDPEHGTTGFWNAPPASWEDVPEERLLSRETRAEIDQAIAGLPPAQRAVITMRDVDGWSSEEVRNVLDLSETNQRVLLHRARSKVRSSLEQYVGGQGRA